MSRIGKQPIKIPAGVKIEINGQNVSVETLLLLLRGVGRLDDVESMLADEGPSPIELAKRQGKERQRASGKRSKGKSDDGQW